MYYYKDLWNLKGKDFLEIISANENLDEKKLSELLVKVILNNLLKE